MNAVKYGSPVIQTFTGKNINLLFPDYNLIDIEDIAEGLSKLCRFSGQCKRFYSVATHSIMVSKTVPNHLRLAALLHDATEAYLGDVIKPLKNLLPDYQKIEYLWESAIKSKFKLYHNKKDLSLIKAEDCKWYSTESLELMENPVVNPRFKAYNHNLPYWDIANISRSMFMYSFNECKDLHKVTL